MDMNCYNPSLINHTHYLWRQYSVDMNCYNPSLINHNSRISDQNGVSLLYIMPEIHHSGWEPLNYSLFGEAVFNGYELLQSLTHQPYSLFGEAIFGRYELLQSLTHQAYSVDMNCCNLSLINHIHYLGRQYSVDMNCYNPSLINHIHCLGRQAVFS